MFGGPRKASLKKKSVKRLAKVEKYVSLQSLTGMVGPENRLGYGVMVTLQILVLSFPVRIQVAQQEPC